MTGKQRVLAQLYKAPVTLADFDRDTAIDGGARITRLAARIQDLKDDGYAISRRMVRLGSAMVAEYRLVDLAPEESRRSPGTSIGTEAKGLRKGSAAPQGQTRSAIFDVDDFEDAA